MYNMYYNHTKESDMFNVEITKVTHPNAWYKKLIFKTFEVIEDKDRENIYWLTDEQLEKLGRKRKMAILKQDCKKVEIE